MMDKIGLHGRHLGFTFHWPVSIPDMEIEFTDPEQANSLKSRGKPLEMNVMPMKLHILFYFRQ